MAGKNAMGMTGNRLPLLTKPATQTNLSTTHHTGMESKSYWDRSLGLGHSSVGMRSLPESALLLGLCFDHLDSLTSSRPGTRLSSAATKTGRYKAYAVLTCILLECWELKDVLLDFFRCNQFLFLHFLFFSSCFPSFQLPLPARLCWFRKLSHLSGEGSEDLDGPTAHFCSLILLTAKLICGGHFVQGKNMQLLILRNFPRGAIVFFCQGAHLERQAKQSSMHEVPTCKNTTTAFPSLFTGRPQLLLLMSSQHCGNHFGWSSREGAVLRCEKHPAGEG